MFNKSVNDRLSTWINFRHQLDIAQNPLQEVWDFWHTSPFIPYNKNIDPYNKKSWPSPWEIIAENKYDDFTRSLMIAWTLKLTEKFKQSKIEIKTLVDKNRNRQYNLVFVDDTWIINFEDDGPIPAEENFSSFKLENLIEIEIPR